MSIFGPKSKENPPAENRIPATPLVSTRSLPDVFFLEELAGFLEEAVFLAVGVRGSVLSTGAFFGGVFLATAFLETVFFGFAFVTFFAADFFSGTLRAAGFLAAGFFDAVDFLDVDFFADLAVDCFATVFEAADFLAAGFLALAFLGIAFFGADFFGTFLAAFGERALAAAGFAADFLREAVVRDLVGDLANESAPGTPPRVGEIDCRHSALPNIT